MREVRALSGMRAKREVLIAVSGAQAYPTVMEPDILDRPVWHALSGPQAEFAIGGANARRFHPDFGPLAGPRDHGPESLAELGALVPEEGLLFILQKEACPPPPGTVVERTAELVQMVAARRVEGPIEAPIEPLTDADAPEMLALARLTQPGPFERRTHELGQFWGIREQGRLIAMMGEQRMRLPGHIEMTALCTHPDFRGRGYGAQLMVWVASRIQGSDNAPFLHAYASNVGAIRLYETLGFVVRIRPTLTVLRCA